MLTINIYNVILNLIKIEFRFNGDLIIKGYF